YAWMTRATRTRAAQGSALPSPGTSPVRTAGIFCFQIARWGDYARRYACRYSAALEADDFSSNHPPPLVLCLSMIFFRKPVPTFRDHALNLDRALIVVANVPAPAHPRHELGNPTEIISKPGQTLAACERAIQRGHRASMARIVVIDPRSQHGRE